MVYFVIGREDQVCRRKKWWWIQTWWGPRCSGGWMLMLLGFEALCHSTGLNNKHFSWWLRSMLQSPSDAILKLKTLTDKQGQSYVSLEASPSALRTRQSLMLIDASYHKNTSVITLNKIFCQIHFISFRSLLIIAKPPSTLTTEEIF